MFCMLDNCKFKNCLTRIGKSCSYIFIKLYALCKITMCVHVAKKESIQSRNQSCLFKWGTSFTVWAQYCHLENSNTCTKQPANIVHHSAKYLMFTSYRHVVNQYFHRGLSAVIGFSPGWWLVYEQGIVNRPLFQHWGILVGERHTEIEAQLRYVNINCYCLVAYLTLCPKTSRSCRNDSPLW